MMNVNMNSLDSYVNDQMPNLTTSYIQLDSDGSVSKSNEEEVISSCGELSDLEEDSNAFVEELDNYEFTSVFAYNKDSNIYKIRLRNCINQWILQV